jgi:hypothetical protein
MRADFKGQRGGKKTQISRSGERKRKKEEPPREAPAPNTIQISL